MRRWSGANIFFPKILILNRLSGSFFVCLLFKLELSIMYCKLLFFRVVARVLKTGTISLKRINISFLYLSSVYFFSCFR